MLRFAKNIPSFNPIPNVFFRQMVCPSGILLGQINDIICEYLMHNVRIPWMRLKPQVSPRVTKEVNPLYLSPTAVGVDENTRELYIYTKQLIA